MMSVMKISMVVVVFFGVCIPALVEAAGGGGKGKERMIVFDQSVLDRGLAVMRTRLHVGSGLMRRPVEGDLVYAVVGRATANMLAGVEGTPTPLVWPGIIVETRQQNGLFAGEMTIVVAFNNDRTTHRHMNMNMGFYRNEAAPGDDVQAAIAADAAAYDGSSGVAGAASSGTSDIAASPYEIGPRSSTSERDLVLQLNCAAFELQDAQNELSATLVSFNNAELRNQYLQTEHGRLTAENQRFAAQLESLRTSIAATAAETIVAIAAAAAAGVAEGIARAAAAAAENEAIDAAGAVGGAAAAVAAVAVVAAVDTNADDDPGTHDDETPQRKRSKRQFFNPRTPFHGRMSDWKDGNDNCGGSRV